MNTLPQHAERLEHLWTTTPPNKPCTVRWTKSRKWDVISREVTRRDDGTLVCFASRLGHTVPLELVQGYWLKEDLILAGCPISKASKCVAGKSIFRTTNLKSLPDFELSMQNMQNTRRLQFPDTSSPAHGV